DGTSGRPWPARCSIGTGSPRRLEANQPVRSPKEPDMRTAHAVTVAAPQPQPAASYRLRPVWLVSAVASGVALVVTELYGLAIRLGGVPMAAAGFGQAKAGRVPAGSIELGVAPFS